MGPNPRRDFPFDAVVLSHWIWLMKPVRGFFEKCVKACGQFSRECVFVDDLAENVEGARKAGLRGMHYVRGTEKWIEELREEGVEV